MFFSDRDFWSFMVVLALIFAALGAGLAYGIPWLWDMLKALLHEATA